MTGKDRAARNLTTHLKKKKEKEKKKQSPPPLKNVKSREPPTHQNIMDKQNKKLIKLRKWHAEITFVKITKLKDYDQTEKLVLRVKTARMRLQKFLNVPRYYKK